MQIPSASRGLEPNGSSRLFGISASRGLTLLEMTVVLMVLFSLVAILFVGAQAWKRGSDRALCIVHLHSVQKSVRSYSNLYGFSPGMIVPDLQSNIFGVGKFIESVPSCPGSGVYTIGEAYGPDTIPPMGVLYMECSYATDQRHAPDDASSW